MKKKITTLLIVGAAIAALVGCGAPEQTTTELQVELGEELVIAPTDFLDIDADKAGSVTMDTSAIDVNKLGTYELIATHKNTTYTVEVEVVDTVAPMADRCLPYIKAETAEEIDLASAFEIYETGEYTVDYAYVEKVGELADATDKHIEGLINADKDIEALAAGASDVKAPAENGLYQCVVSISDASANTIYEEVYVVLGTEEVAEEETETDADANESQSEKKDTNTSSSNSSSNKNNTSSNTSSNSNSTSNNSSSSSSNSSSNSDSSSSNGSSSKAEDDTASGTGSNTKVPEWYGGSAYDYANLSDRDKYACQQPMNTVFEYNGSYCVVTTPADDSKGDDMIIEYLNKKGLTATGYGGHQIDAGKKCITYVTADQIIEYLDPNDPDNWTW